MRSDMPRMNKLYVGLVMTVISFLLIGYWVVKPALVDYRAYVSFSPDLDGTKAWRELLEQRQSQVKEWRLTWRDLPDHGNQLLVAIQPAGITDEERAELYSWIEQGNDMILFHYAPRGWERFSLEELDPESGILQGEEQGQEQGQGRSSGEKVDVGDGMEQSDDLHSVYVGENTVGEGLTAEVLTSYRLAGGPELQEVLFMDDQGILGSRVDVGAGSLTVILAPDWLTNDSILDHSHFELVWRLFDKSWDAVWIDETHHGYQQKPGLLVVYPAWLVLACVQLSIALLLWLWLRGKRFGTVHTPRAWTVRRGDETLQAVAGWYERLGHRAAALNHQQQLLRQLLYEHWGLSPSASTAQAAQLARSRWPETQVARLVRLLELGPPAEPGAPMPSHVHAKEFLSLTREMSEMIALLEQKKI